MAEIIRMPKMSDTMEEGVIASWIKKEGDEVSSGDILAEVETDKATMELESYQDGVLLYIGVKEQDAVPVDGVIAIIGEKGEDISELLKEIESGASDGSSNSSEETSSGENEGETLDTSDINATVITMPKMSDTMEEGVIASWLKAEGDEISSGDILAEVETDKATMELEAYEDGTLLHIAIEAGGSVPIDGPIAIVGEKGADWESLLKAHKAKGKSDSTQPPKEEASSENKVTDQPTTNNSAPTATSTSSNGRIKASPLAKKLAEEKGINIADVNGSGDGGRIIKRDVEDFTPNSSQSAQPQTESSKPSISLPVVSGEEVFEEVKMTSMRKAIAKNLNNSQFGAPHFYLTMDINMDKAIEARKSMNEVSPVKISFNDIVIKASSVALRSHPMVNSQVSNDGIMQAKHVHVGVAVAIPDGLVVPVLKHADLQPLSAISLSVKDLAGRAKDKKLSQDEMTGATFTISNLGMFGIEQFTSILNAPASCILAVGGINQVPIVKDGQIVPGNVMKITLTCDHRAVDGAIGAAFLQTLKGLLEDPVRILI